MDFVDAVSEWARVRRKGATAWSIIAALFALSLLARALGGARLEPTPFITFVPALPIATLLCGWRRALALLAGSTLAGAVWNDGHAEGGLFPAPMGFRIFAVAALGLFLIAATEAMTQAVQRLEAAARLNAELFRELQHRVANNFQFVAATLHRTRRGLADEQAAAALDRAIQRIDALGRLHRRLYEPDSYAAGLEPVLRDMLAETFADKTVRLALAIDSEGLEVGRLTDLLLLINEAAVNANKHAFAAGGGGLFAVELKRTSSERVLAIGDDGPGFPPSAASGDRLGLDIMRGLAARLGGKLDILSGPGAQIRVSFRV